MRNNSILSEPYIQTHVCFYHSYAYLYIINQSEIIPTKLRIQYKLLTLHEMISLADCLKRKLNESFESESRDMGKTLTIIQNTNRHGRRSSHSNEFFF